MTVDDIFGAGLVLILGGGLLLILHRLGETFGQTGILARIRMGWFVFTSEIELRIARWAARAARGK